ncbi:MAG: asparagine synthase (glutamine-hydrolyzing) [Flavobacteriales bacterium]|nr:asparagine synthase (glutamine-hydrolyzing) [Flavobacteriales bacterium]
MCGILGYISHRVQPEAHDRALQLLKHRGPDAEGSFHGDGIGMGHTRLAVLDTSAVSNQPMFSHDGRYVIVFNGEIYNYKQLRAQLPYPYKTHSDTEVLLAAYIKWGQDMPLYMHGMFAIAIWDQTEHTLFLCRDRVGIKPLYIGRHHQDVYFASEIKALNALMPEPAIHDMAVASFLRYGFVAGGATFYKGVGMLPPGCTEIIRNGQARRGCYWALSQEKYNGGNRQNDFEEEFLEVFSASVRERLISDVPLGTFLSGGVDSSLVTAIAAREVPSKLKTFSIGFEEKEFNELHYASQVAKHLGTEHTEWVITEKDAMEHLMMAMDHFDQPFADASALPTLLVSQMARKHVTVALAGDGADELFMGYGRFAWMRRFQNPMIWHFRHLAAFVARNLNNTSGETWAQILKAPDKSSLPAHIFASEQAYHSTKEIATMTAIRYEEVEKEICRSIRSQQGSLMEQFAFEYHHYLPEDLLVKVDMMSMKSGLEVRVPFLDHRLVSWAASLPEKLKFPPGGEQKWLLKNILCRFLPEELVYRTKRGFGIPLAKWLRGELHFLIDDHLSAEKVHACRWLHGEAVRQSLKKFESGDDQQCHRIWQALLLSRFFNR